jgi:hypothetical protein
MDKNKEVVSVGLQSLIILNVEHELLEVPRSEIDGCGGKYFHITTSITYMLTSGLC